jgi:hypothetical protein
VAVSSLFSIGDDINNLWHDAYLVNARSVANVVAQLIKSTKPIDDEKAGKVTRRSAPSNSFGLVDLGKNCLHDHAEL